LCIRSGRERFPDPSSYYSPRPSVSPPSSPWPSCSLPHGLRTFSAFHLRISIRPLLCVTTPSYPDFATLSSLTLARSSRTSLPSAPRSHRSSPLFPLPLLLCHLRSALCVAPRSPSHSTLRLCRFFRVFSRAVSPLPCSDGLPGLHTSGARPRWLLAQRSQFLKWPPIQTGAPFECFGIYDGSQIACSPGTLRKHVASEAFLEGHSFRVLEIIGAVFFSNANAGESGPGPCGQSSSLAGVARGSVGSRRPRVGPKRRYLGRPKSNSPKTRLTLEPATRQRVLQAPASPHPRRHMPRSWLRWASLHLQSRSR
jgi:hypothetical protein